MLQQCIRRRSNSDVAADLGLHVRDDGAVPSVPIRVAAPLQGDHLLSAVRPARRSGNRLDQLGALHVLVEAPGAHEFVVGIADRLLHCPLQREDRDQGHGDSAYDDRHDGDSDDELYEGEAGIVELPLGGGGHPPAHGLPNDGDRVAGRAVSLHRSMPMLDAPATESDSRLR